MFALDFDEELADEEAPLFTFEVSEITPEFILLAIRWNNYKLIGSDGLEYMTIVVSIPSSLLGKGQQPVIFT